MLDIYSMTIGSCLDVMRTRDMELINELYRTGNISLTSNEMEGLRKKYLPLEYVTKSKGKYRFNNLLSAYIYSTSRRREIFEMKMFYIIDLFRTRSFWEDISDRAYENGATAHVTRLLSTGLEKLGEMVYEQEAMRARFSWDKGRFDNNRIGDYMKVHRKRQSRFDALLNYASTVIEADEFEAIADAYGSGDISGLLEKMNGDDLVFKLFYAANLILTEDAYKLFESELDKASNITGATYTAFQIQQYSLKEKVLTHVNMTNKLEADINKINQRYQ
jgi:hypothetical protein